MYLEAVAIPLAIGSSRRNLSITACTKFAPTRPVRTTTAAVRDEFAPKAKHTRKTKHKRLALSYLNKRLKETRKYHSFSKETPILRGILAQLQLTLNF